MAASKDLSKSISLYVIKVSSLLLVDQSEEFSIKYLTCMGGKDVLIDIIIAACAVTIAVAYEVPLSNSYESLIDAPNMLSPGAYTLTQSP